MEQWLLSLDDAHFVSYALALPFIIAAFGGLIVFVLHLRGRQK